MGGVDSVLLRRWIADGDAEAFNEIVRRHADMVYATCRRILRNRADAEDVAQECFLRLAVAAREVRTSVTGWLHAAAVSRSLNLIKRDSRRREREQRFAEQHGATGEVAWDDLEELIDEAIADLADDLRAPVVAHFLERRTHDAIAREAGIPRRTVTHRIGLGVEAIREHLRKRGLPVASACLAAHLTAHGSESAPATLFGALGKIAMSGVRSTLPAALETAVSSGGYAVFWKVAAAACIVLASGAWFVTHRIAADRESTVLEARPLAPARTTPPSPPPAPDTPGRGPSLVDQLTQHLSSAPTAETGLISDPSQYISVSGVVKDGSGQPIAGAKVLLAVSTSAPAGRRAYEDEFREDYLVRSRVYEASSDAMGRYRFSEVRYEGHALACAAKNGYAGNKLAIDMKSGETYSGKDLDLTPGITLNGALSAEDGTPVSDAVVTTIEAWNQKKYAWGWGFDVTGEHGLFALSFSPEAEWVNLRVNSDSRGQDFFIRLPVTKGSFQLRMKPKASLHGTVSWTDGRPAEGVAVSVTGEVPYPDMNTMYTGIRPDILERVLVGTDGRYSLSGLYPGLHYRFFITRDEPGKRPSVSTPLSPLDLTPLVFAAGENRELNREIADAIFVKGHVITQGTRRPVPGLTLEVTREIPTPARLAGHASTDQEGAFTFQSGAGPGVYAFGIVDLGPTTSEFRDRFRNLPGAQLQLAAGETRETEIVVPEPAQFPVRVVDQKGDSPVNVECEIHLIGENGKRGSSQAYVKLDLQGRHTFFIYEAAREVWVEVGKGISAGTPKTASGHYAVTPGERLPEETIVLEPTCTVTGILRDARGNKLAGVDMLVKGDRENAETDRVPAITDKEGRFTCTDGFHAGLLSFRISSDQGNWSSEPVECPPDAIVDLGEIVLTPRL